MSSKQMDLTKNETLLFEYISNQKTDEIRRILSADGIKIDCLDKSGMTPLQHAAFKANVDVCKLLIASGANVNTDRHEKGYTTLMFAVLAGNKVITQILLEAGANTTRKNTLGRTASQMAAFVGQYHCVSLINNYFERSVLAYFSRTQGLETEPKLPVHLLQPLYQLVIRTNLNPVGFALFTRVHSTLLRGHERAHRVLDLLCERNMKGADANHIHAVKFHYLSCLLTACGKAFLSPVTDPTSYEKFIVELLQSNEKFIRGTFSSFPYMECPIIQQIVRTIYNVQIGDEPSGLSVLSTSINGQRYLAEDEVECNTCGTANKSPKKCINCKMVTYCDKECQKLHWNPVHRKQCKSLKQTHEQMIKAQEVRDAAELLQKQSADKQKALEQQKETAEQQNKTVEQQKETAEQQKETSEQQEETVEQQKETSEQQKETVEEQKETVEQQKETVEQKDEAGDMPFEDITTAGEDNKKLNGIATEKLREKETKDQTVDEAMKFAAGEVDREMEAAEALCQLSLNER